MGSLIKKRLLESGEPMYLLHAFACGGETLQLVDQLDNGPRWAMTEFSIFEILDVNYGS